MNHTYLRLALVAYCAVILWVSATHPPSPQTVPAPVPAPLDGPGYFIEFHRAIRTAENATGPEYEPGHLLRERQAARTRAAARKRSAWARTQSNGVLEWTERGPSNVPGRTRGLIVDPDDPQKNTWYAGSVAGGVWKTTNGGLAWTLLTPDLSNLATTVLAMAESNHNVIYLGTGEGFGNLDGVSGNGMFKSIDRGNTWTYLPSTSDFDDVNRAIVDPTNENIAVVATNDGIYRTSDGGTSWTKTFDQPFIQDLRAKPGDFAMQYAARNNVGIFKSTDGGLTWQSASTGLVARGRIELAIAPSNPNRLYAAVENDDLAKLYTSTNEGILWNPVSVRFNNTDIDFLGGQGWYDNTLAVDPFNETRVYLGGVGMFRTQLLGSSPTLVKSYSIENNTGFISLTDFTAAHANGTLDVGTGNNTTVELRFGPGISQLAHRFEVPATGGPQNDGGASIPDPQYTYRNYVPVPFQAWEVDTEGNDVRQLMVSFRDQERDGRFNLNVPNGSALLNAREYVYVHTLPYSTTAAAAITTPATAGHTRNRMYFFWPVLSAGATWNETNLPTSELRIVVTERPEVSATTITVADVYGEYDRKNEFVTFGTDFHPDQHNIVMIPMSGSTYKMLVANDGGLFVSNTSATPGINAGDWEMRGNTFNTTQFYGADKRPGRQEYFGGTQDNGTWYSRDSENANRASSYVFAIGGDGFEVIWHNLDDKKMIGGSQFNNFRRSTDGGRTWASATLGLSGTHPFISKLANSKHFPDRIFTLSSEGVLRSENFGQNWTLTRIAPNWGTATSFMDVEVSRANANIVWAGSGMTATRSLHVSTNGGTSFAVTPNYTNEVMGGITKLASHPTEANTAYALFSMAGKPKILRTTNLGQSWADISGFEGNPAGTRGFPNVAVYCLYVHPHNTDILWAGTEIGIVESLDNGTTWALLDEFPNVSVWDMKGQDNEVVIATHGRGIWTATMSAVQETMTAPRVIAGGTAPNGALALEVDFQDTFDSTDFFVDDVRAARWRAKPIGSHATQLKNVSPGDRSVHLVSYRGGAPFRSATVTIAHLALRPVADQYFDYFVNGSNWFVRQMNILSFGPGNQALQSFHTYGNNANSTATLRQPIRVTNSPFSFSYDDVALVEAGSASATFGQPEFKDYVIPEATKDGLRWVALKEGYNASYNAAWQAAVAANTAGRPDMLVNHSLQLTDRFAESDTLLFRFRLYSDASGSFWGWALDNLYIQQKPTSITAEKTTALRVYPNPTEGPVTLAFDLAEPGPVSVAIYDTQGKLAATDSFAGVRGRNERRLSLARAGVYVARVKGNGFETSVKVVVR
ncbi:MAG: T9SS type A sorting domain-containing protein [Cyclobacteriaceae bacterium]|jgi:photosystem II stability/assembly factor-like uncharacterized protein|nr:T9SS type A sorting domain-containing protein [Cyclobacteriaceae bacterium]